jgi:hypothetical protein
MTPVFEWAKTVHALDYAATVIGMFHLSPGLISGDLIIQLLNIDFSLKRIKLR